MWVSRYPFAGDRDGYARERIRPPRRTAAEAAIAGGFRRDFPGQSAGVSLPVSQQRVLEGIESALESAEPRLRSMFAIFTRLTRDEGAPRTEALRAETLLRRAPSL